MLAVLLFIFLCVHSCFESDKAILITNIHERSFADTIFNVYSLKSGGQVLVVTKLANCDTPLVLDGVIDSTKLWFSSYSDNGIKAWEDSNISILSKKANSDIFYLWRGKQMMAFRVSKRGSSIN